jgi:HAD superfamily hydrolase (TIGR01549 family)
MKYKAVIFDFDDTLVESRELKWAQHKLVAKKFYNIDLTDEDIRPHWGKPLDSLLKEIYRDSDVLEKMHESLMSVRDQFLKQAYPQALNLVKKLLESGVEVGIVSATHKKYLVDDLSRLGFPYEDFFVLQGSDEVSFHKPDPRVFDAVLEYLSKKEITKEEVLYVGDSMDDFLAATKAGINFIGITKGLYSKEDFQRAGAGMIVSSIEELLGLI